MYQLKNSNEELIADITRDLMAETEMCQCDKCRLDVMALALNSLPPSYVVTYAGGLFANIDATNVQMQADAMSAVLKAIAVVSRSPHHDL